MSKKSYRGKIVNDVKESGSILRAEPYANHLEIKYLEGSGEPWKLFWNEVTEPFCISKEFVDILTLAKISGWKAIPTAVFTKSGHKTVNDYFALSVTGRAGPMDYLKSDIVFEQLPGGLFPHFKGLYFEPHTWDGSDIFMANPYSSGKITAFIYVTKRVVDILKKNKIANIRFVNFNDYLLDCEIVKIGADEILKKQIIEKVRKAKM